MSGVDVRLATCDDLADVLEVQRDAFGRVAAMFDVDPAVMPPLKESLEELGELLDSGTVFFVAIDTVGQVVGSVRGLESEGTVAIGRLVVAGRAVRQGVATALMSALESHFVHARSFELFTGADATVPLALYRGRGYVEFKRETGPAVELVWLRKMANQ